MKRAVSYAFSITASPDEERQGALCLSPSALSGASTGLWWDGLSQDATVDIVVLALLGLQSLAPLPLSLPHTSCDSSFWISPRGVIFPKPNYDQVNLITLLQE